MTDELLRELKNMVLVYWGDEGDGGPPPACIVSAWAAITKAEAQQRKGPATNSTKSRPLRGRGDPVILLKMDLFEALVLLETLGGIVGRTQDDLSKDLSVIHGRLEAAISARKSGPVR